MFSIISIVLTFMDTELRTNVAFFLFFLATPADWQAACSRLHANSPAGISHVHARLIIAKSHVHARLLKAVSRAHAKLLKAISHGPEPTPSQAQVARGQRYMHAYVHILTEFMLFSVSET